MQEGLYSAKAGQAVTKANISQQITAMLEDTATKAENLVSYAANKLSPVIGAWAEKIVEDAKRPLESTYPPLFDEYRSYIKRINVALSNIEDTLSHTEV